jgi:hypothetical protein
MIEVISVLPEEVPGLKEAGLLINTSIQIESSPSVDGFV